MKDSSGRHVRGAGRIYALMVGGAAIGIGAVLHGLSKGPNAATALASGVLLLLAVGTLGIAMGVTQWRRRNLQPPDDATVSLQQILAMRGREQSLLWQLLLPVQLVLAAGWATFLIISFARERWIGVVANGLLLAMSSHSVIHALRRRSTS